MQPKSNPLARQLSSTPQTHRTSTLQAISDKVHATTARIEFLKAEGLRMNELLQNVPEDSGSRLAWLNSQLHQS